MPLSRATYSHLTCTNEQLTVKCLAQGPVSRSNGRLTMLKFDLTTYNNAHTQVPFTTLSTVELIQ